MVKRNKKNQDDFGWGDVVAEAPRAKIESERSKTVKQWALRVLLWSILLTWPLLAISVVQSIVIPEKTPPAPEAPELSGPGRFAAEQQILAWIGGNPSPLPGGRIVSYDGSVTMKTMSVKQADGQDKIVESAPKGTTVTIEKFTVVDKEGRGFKASVQVATDVIGGSTAVSGVSLTPVEAPLAFDYTNMSPWLGLDPMSAVPPSIQTSVKSWITAYTEGDDDALRQFVGDTDVTHVYMSLKGVAAATADAKKVAYLDATKERALVRVEVSLRWNGTSVPEQVVTPVLSTFDLLVEQASTASPKVVAWGGPGSGPDLVRYGNSVTLPEDMSEMNEPKAPEEPAGTTASTSPSVSVSPSPSATPSVGD